MEGRYFNLNVLENCFQFLWLNGCKEGDVFVRRKYDFYSVVIDNFVLVGRMSIWVVVVIWVKVM